MPQRKAKVLQSLEELCLSAVVRCIETDLVLCEVAKTLSVSSLLLHRIDLSLPFIAKQLSDYMSFLPGTLSEMVRQKITTRVIKKYILLTSSSNRDTSPFKCLPPHTMTVRLLEIVLDETVNTFDLSELQPLLNTESLRPAPGDPELWEVVLGRCSGLKKFALPPLLRECFGITLHSFVSSLTQQCQQLTEIILKDALNDGKTLATFGTNCSSLKVLDIAGSYVFCSDILYLIYPELDEKERPLSLKVKKYALLPEEAIKYSQSRLCSTLHVLNISDTKVKSLGASYALRYMPNLTSLGECYHVASGLKKRGTAGWNTFKLKQVFCRDVPNERIISLCSVCPDLETLSIGSGVSYPLSFELSILGTLKHLRRLSLQSISCVDLTGLKHILQLTDLHLNIPEVDLGHIAESCPLLERLVLSREPKKSCTLSADVKWKLVFSCLQEWTVDTVVPFKAAELVITRATCLRIVKVVRVKKLTDKILSVWLDINPMVHLQTWLMNYSHLTLKSVSLLLNRCPNLSTIGRLSGWDVRSWESRRLQRAWQDYDVNMVLFSYQQQDIAQIIDATASSDEGED